MTVPQAVTYGAVWLAAERGIAAPSDGELLELTGFCSYSGPNRLLGALQRLNLIAATGFQRGRQIEVLAIGKTTSAPPCLKPHWRHRGGGHG